MPTSHFQRLFLDRFQQKRVHLLFTIGAVKRLMLIGKQEFSEFIQLHYSTIFAIHQPQHVM
jgi:hypothetical protein